MQVSRILTECNVKGTTLSVEPETGLFSTASTISAADGYALQ
jgi:hypothetical protein